MLLWLVFAALSAAVLTALLRPLMSERAAPLPVPEEAGSSAVYRDQLAEVETDLQRGLIGPREAESAKAEIARRLLAAHRPDEMTGISPGDGRADPEVNADAMGGRRRTAILAVAVGLLVPVVAISIYMRAGKPGIPAQPFAQRPSAVAPVAQQANPELSKLIAAVEKRLEQNPQDGRGWDVIAPVYLQLGRYTDARNAYDRALTLNGESSSRLAGLAEASMLENRGRILPEARAALGKILARDPENVRARFWLAHAKEQDGQLAEAKADYEELLAKAPPDAPWRAPLEQRIAAIAGTASPGSATVPPGPVQPPGPTSEDIAAAASMKPEERLAMIEGMVSGLAARLEKDGNDLAGWQRLIRAYTVLGRKGDAVAALGRARKSFEGDAQTLAVLAELAKELGLES